MSEPSPGTWPAPPPARPVAAPAPATGKALLSACWALLRQDRELLWLPVIAAISGLIAALILFVPGFAIGWVIGGSNHHSWGGWVGGAFAVFAASVVSIYFQAALVIGANQRADGGDPSVGDVLAEAWSHRGKILSWAVVTTTVGYAIRALERRLGILGTILGFLGGLAWAIASFLVVPVVIAENLGPIAAVKRSAQLIRETWGTSVRTELRLGLAYVLLSLIPLVVVMFGVGVIIANGSTAGVVIGVLFVMAGVAGFFAIMTVFSAISSYARALIYRYATGRPVPGIDPSLFVGVFTQKGKRRGFA
ncbi:MAG TPA: DUF6159 family protein [Mycobacteriales bacterium]|nr:DUF6159 family protein [Mycobacteriales bacterium]